MKNRKTLKTIANTLNEISKEARKNHYTAEDIINAWRNNDHTQYADIIIKLNKITALCEMIYKSCNSTQNPRDDIGMFLIGSISYNHKVKIKKTYLVLAKGV